MRQRTSGRLSRSDAPVVAFRDDVRRSDMVAVRDLAAAAGNFSTAEIGVAVELVEAHLAQGAWSGYRFLFAERAESLLGYACYGPVPLTRSAYDLYWIVVAPAAKGTGLGAALLRRVEAEIGEAGGDAVYVDTSSRLDYAPTRRFYESNGYSRVAELPDFYAPGDGKVIYRKRLTMGPRPA